MRDGRPHCFPEWKVRQGHLPVSTQGVRREREGGHGVSPPQIPIQTEAVTKVLEQGAQLSSPLQDSRRAKLIHVCFSSGRMVTSIL